MHTFIISTLLSYNAIHAVGMNCADFRCSYVRWQYTSLSFIQQEYSFQLTAKDAAIAIIREEVRCSQVATIPCRVHSEMSCS